MAVEASLYETASSSELVEVADRRLPEPPTPNSPTPNPPAPVNPANSEVPALESPILENSVQDGRVKITAPTVTPPASSSEPVTDAKTPPHLQQVRQALTNTHQRYPFLLNPTGRVQSRFTGFNGTKRDKSAYIDLSYTDRQFTIDDLTVADFPKSQQLYWILPGNRIVMETKGWVGEVDYQGRATDTTIVRQFKTSQVLWGLQSAWLLPQPLQDLVSQDKFQNNSSILTVAGEVVNPDVANNVAINLDIIPNPRSNEISSSIAPIQTPRIGTASTSSSQGGGSLFSLLEAANAPLVLQAFPTNNMQVLLEGEGLFQGARVSPTLLTKAGITFGNPFTGEGFEFQPELTSQPGIKVAKPDQFDNFDLLNVLVNPFLDEKQRRLYYLNSLHWVSLGVRPPTVVNTTTNSIQQNWYQAKLQRPHNRTLLQYEATPGRATYYNLFSNPGAAISFSFDAQAIHLGQSWNTTAGSLLGMLFSWIHPFRLEKSLWEAKLRLNREEAFKPLRTETTSDQRRQINQRLDRALNIAQINSGIAQVSGILAMPAAITPDRADMFQVRAGNYRRRVRLFDGQETAQADEIYIDKLKLSDREFGPLTTIGVPVPKSLTNITTKVQEPNRSTAVKTIVTSNDGSDRLVFEENSGSVNLSLNDTALTSVPVGVRTFDSAFDRIELAQNGRVKTLIEGFDGYQYVPALEAVWQRSRGEFNYAWSTGTWQNLAPNSAPNVKQNRLGKREPSMGIYTNAMVNWTKSGIRLNQAKQVTKSLRHLGTVQFSWNSAPNQLNPAYLNLNYTYVQQTPAMNYVGTVGALLTAYSQKIEPTLFNRNQWGWKSGLDVITSLEVSDRSNFLVETLQRISSRWSAGLYYQNFRTNPGLAERLQGKEYGLIAQYRSRPGNSWQARFSFDRQDWKLQLQGNISF
jgi:hypothetical protein